MSTRSLLTTSCEPTLAKLTSNCFPERSNYDQNSKIRSIKNNFKGLACGLQGSRKSRQPYSAKWQASLCQVFWLPSSNCQHLFYSSHRALIQAKFWPIGKLTNHAESDGVGYSSINSPMKLHTANLLVLLTQGNTDTAANPALTISACKAPSKASYIISFSLSSGFRLVLDYPFF